MVDKNSKQFATYLLGQMFPVLFQNQGQQQQAQGAGLTTQAIVTRLSTVIPGFDANQLNVSSGVDWENTIVPKIVDYYAERYQGQTAQRASA